MVKPRWRKVARRYEDGKRFYDDETYQKRHPDGRYWIGPYHHLCQYTPCPYSYPECKKGTFVTYYFVCFDSFPDYKTEWLVHAPTIKEAKRLADEHRDSEFPERNWPRSIPRTEDRINVD